VCVALFCSVLQPRHLSWPCAHLNGSHCLPNIPELQCRLQHVAICCSVSQCVAVWCGVLQCAAVCVSTFCSEMQPRHLSKPCALLSGSNCLPNIRELQCALQRDAVWDSVLQCVAVRVAVCCSVFCFVLQCVAATSSITTMRAFECFRLPT